MRPHGPPPATADPTSRPNRPSRPRGDHESRSRRSSPSRRGPTPPPRTLPGLVAFALLPPLIVLALARPALAVLAVVLPAAAALAARRATVDGSRIRVAVRVPLVDLRVEVGVSRPDRVRS